MSKRQDLKFSQAFELYSTGLSLEKVAHVIGITRQALYDAFKFRGYVLRSAILRPFQMYDGKKFSLRNSGYYALTSDSRVSIHRYIWEHEVGPIPEGWDIHHIDEDKTHNEVSNFECLPKADHTRKHGFKNNQYTKYR